MSVTPRVSMVAYCDREPGFIFVAVPNQRGRYIRTDAAVALVPCPHCKAQIGEPCLSRGSVSGTANARYCGDIHLMRKKEVLYGKRKGVEDVLRPTIDTDAEWAKETFDSIRIENNEQSTGTDLRY